jgi:hypothetical protein
MAVFTTGYTAFFILSDLTISVTTPFHKPADPEASNNCPDRLPAR